MYNVDWQSFLDALIKFCISVDYHKERDQNIAENSNSSSHHAHDSSTAYRSKECRFSTLCSILQICFSKYYSLAAFVYFIQYFRRKPGNVQNRRFSSINAKGKTFSVGTCTFLLTENKNIGK